MLKIVYMGTPEFSVLPLKKLIENGDKYKVIAVVTNRDKFVGRKRILTPSPVKTEAIKAGIPVYCYDKIRVEGVEDMKSLAPDIMVTCAFGQILSKEILDIPKLGVINVHASLLPKYRGASPVHFAVLNGEKETGVTIMKTDEGIDTGDMILSEKINIFSDETTGELFERLSILGADLLIKALGLISDGKAIYTPQDNAIATTTKMIKKEMAKIDWNETAENIVNRVRAFLPSPVAYTFYKGLMLKVYKAEKIDGFCGKCGEVLKSDGELIVSAKNGAVKILTLQKSGGNVLSAADFLRGNRIEKGSVLD